MYQLAEPDRRRFEHVDVVFSSRCLHVWTGREEEYSGGQARKLKMGQLTLSMGTATGTASSYKEPPSK
jgi:hypothetical protein